MTLTFRTLLLVLAVILFVVDAVGSVSGVSLNNLGLACFAGSFLAPDRVIQRR